jgi:putative ABC transport system substrate-binding protein
MPVDVQMAYIKKLKPKLRNIAILVNSKNVSAVQTQAEPMMRYARLRGIRTLNLAIKDPKNAKEELAQLVSTAVAKMRKNDPTLDNSIFWITGSTAVFREIAVINLHADRVPVLSVVPDVVSSGDDSAVMSVGISFESNGHLAAIYGASILAGTTTAGELKVGVVTPPDIAINFRKARDIGLKIPFSFFSRASFVYDYDGKLVRDKGKAVAAR